DELSIKRVVDKELQRKKIRDTNNNLLRICARYDNL
ncbi:hypothetical protein SS7213T_03700, partial [Staphylococcus simiae CCM 7213 = CCUG 51256]